MVWQPLNMLFTRNWHRTARERIEAAYQVNVIEQAENACDHGICGAEPPFDADGTGGVSSAAHGVGHCRQRGILGDESGAEARSGT